MTSSRDKTLLPQHSPDPEATVHDDPTDVKRWLVYADWLQQAGDPRGELIALRAQGRDVEAESHEEAHEEVLWGTARQLCGNLGDHTWTGGWQGAQPEPLEATIHWSTYRYGFVNAVTVRG